MKVEPLSPLREHYVYLIKEVVFSTGRPRVTETLLESVT